MADKTGIEWTDATWNPVRGCTRVSPGCGGPGPHGGCYAEGIAARFSKPGQAYEGFARMVDGKPRWTGRVDVIWPLIDLPLHWSKPRRIFVNSMSDLFHESIDIEELATIYAVMVAAVHLRGHIMQVLTKRAAYARHVLTQDKFWEQVNAEATAFVMENTDPLNRRSDDARATHDDNGPDNPPPGIWLGVSVEDQQRADERIPYLLDTPAAVRFLSCEPLLGPVDLTQIEADHFDRDARGITLDALRGGRQSATPWRINWVICGGESGPNARPMHQNWARGLRDQCIAAGVPFFMKQMTKRKPIPDDLMVREFPDA